VKKHTQRHGNANSLFDFALIITLAGGFEKFNLSPELVLKVHDAAAFCEFAIGHILASEQLPSQKASARICGGDLGI
jgi:hypothetical protein